MESHLPDAHVNPLNQVVIGMADVSLVSPWHAYQKHFTSAKNTLQDYDRRRSKYSSPFIPKTAVLASD